MFGRCRVFAVLLSKLSKQHCIPKTSESPRSTCKWIWSSQYRNSFCDNTILTHCRVENCTDFIELRWNIYGWEVGNIFGYNRGTSIFGVIQTIRSNWLRLDWKSQISQKWKIFPLYLLHLIRLCNPQDSQEYFPVKQKYLILYTWALHLI